MQEHVKISNNSEETAILGEEFAQLLVKGDVVVFEGELGAGKTELIKGICSYFNVSELVTSPTFTIINEYNGRDSQDYQLTIFHIDLYRIKKPEELEEIGFEECLFDKESIKLIEWPQRAECCLKKLDYRVNIELDETNDNIRKIKIISQTSK